MTLTIHETLEQGYLQKILRYDKDTGIFYWKMPTKFHPRMIGEVAGCDSTGYRLIRIDRKKYKAHRLAWLYVYGEWPDRSIDHIDGNPFNNRIDNLRLANVSENIANAKRIKGKDLPKGVRKVKTGYQARIAAYGVKYSLGVFETPELASNAYYNKSVELYGEFARRD